MTKNIAVAGFFGGLFTTLLGGWDTGLQNLFILMTLDFCFGVIASAVYHKSKKTDSGRLSSSAMIKGIVKKAAELVVVIVGVQLDRVGGLTYVRDGVIIALCITESLSILENAALCGVPIPDIILKALDVIKGGEHGSN